MASSIARNVRKRNQRGMHPSMFKLIWRRRSNNGRSRSRSRPRTTILARPPSEQPKEANEVSLPTSNTGESSRGPIQQTEINQSSRQLKEMKRKFEVEDGECSQPVKVIRLEEKEELKDMCKVWTLEMVRFFIEKLYICFKRITLDGTTNNVQFSSANWSELRLLINQQQFQCPETGECKDCGKFVVLKPDQVRQKYSSMKQYGCKELVSIKENPDFKSEYMHWQKILTGTEQRSVGASSSTNFSNRSMSASSSPANRRRSRQPDSLIESVVRAVEELNLEYKVHVKAVEMLHGRDSKWMKFFIFSRPYRQLEILRYAMSKYHA